MDLASFGSALSSLGSVTSLLSSALNARDEANRLAATTEALSKLAETQGQLLALQISVSKSNAEHDAALREKRDLEEKLRQLENKNADFERYALHELSPGVFAHAIRQGMEAGEPFHYICTPCRNQNKKSVLQQTTNLHGFSLLNCSVCKTELNLG